MSLDNTPTSPPGLAFGATFSAAFKAVFGQFGTFLKLAAVPFLLSNALLFTDFTLRAIALVGQLPFNPAGPLGILLELTLSTAGFLPITFFGIMTTRHSLGRAQAGVLPSPLLGRRTWAFAGYLLLLLVIFVLLVMAGVAIGTGLQQIGDLADDAGPGTVILVVFAGIAVLLYLMLRFSLVLPAVALDEKLTLAGSWRLTRGNGMKLYGVFLLLLLVLAVMVTIGAIATGSGNFSVGTPKFVIPGGTQVAADGTLVGISWEDLLLANLPRNLWVMLANFLFFAMVCGALASAYTHLSGWGGPRAEILERFE